MKSIFLFLGLIFLLALEILHIYFIMPLPGSQTMNTLQLAYFLDQNIQWIRILALLAILYPFLKTWEKGKIGFRIFLSSLILVYGLVFFFFNFRFKADKMFKEPLKKQFNDISKDTTNQDKLVIGVSLQGEAKAYPIQILGYHHQVMDTLGNIPIMVTYCTVCRTGRVYSPMIKGKKAHFRLVGMDHFNALFEDASGTWWQQATGKAVAGPLKGSSLQELPFQQLSLRSWLRQYPKSQIMQPDIHFQKDYKELAKYDQGTIKSKLEHRDSLSWKPKSWVIGLIHKKTSRAYSWNDLAKESIINDSLNNLPVLLVLENDKASFHVYNRMVNGIKYYFKKGAGENFLDDQTQSLWNMEGECIDGILKGARLSRIQSSQEFWHSWNTFHPETSQYALLEKTK
jgi:hypothetical protein